MTQRSELRLLLKHSGVYAFSRVLNRGIGFLMLPFYTRFLTTDDYGALEVLWITVAYIQSVVDLGIGDSVVRFYLKKDSDRRRVLGTALAVFIPIAAAVAAPSVLFAATIADFVLGSAAYGPHLALAVAVLPLGVAWTVAEASLRADKRSGAITGLSAAKLTLNLSLTIWLVAGEGRGALGVFEAGFITALAFSAVSVWVLSRTGLSRPTRPLAREMWRFGLPFVPSNIAGMVVRSSDRYFVRGFVSLAEAGVYGVGYKFGMVLHQMVTSSFLQVWTPYRLEAEKGEHYPRLFTYFLAVLCFASLGISVFSERLLRIATTPEYLGAAPIIPLVNLGHVVLAVFYHYQVPILASGRTGFYLKINLWSAAATLVLNAGLIYGFGALGAALATVGAYGVRVALVRHYSRRIEHVPFEGGRAAALVGVAAALYGVSAVVGFESLIGDTAFRAALCAAYPLVLALAGFFDAEDRDLIAAGLRKSGLGVESGVGRLLLAVCEPRASRGA